MKRRHKQLQYAIKFLIVFSILIVSFPVSAFAVKVREAETHIMKEIEDFIKNYYESEFKNKEASGEMQKNLVSNNPVLYKKEQIE